MSISKKEVKKKDKGKCKILVGKVNVNFIFKVHHSSVIIKPIYTFYVYMNMNFFVNYKNRRIIHLIAHRNVNSGFALYELHKMNSSIMSKVIQQCHSVLEKCQNKLMTVKDIADGQRVSFSSMSKRYLKLSEYFDLWSITFS